MSGDDQLGRLVAAVALVSTIAAAACDSRSSAAPAARTTPPSSNTTSASREATNAPGIGAEWTQAPGNVQNTRFSTLNQITGSNASNLKLAWTFSTGTLRGHEAAPVVVNNTMYIVTPYPNYVYALDLTKQGALKWMYKPRPASAAQGVACCDVVNRGVAYANGKVIMNTLDAHTIALDADGTMEGWFKALDARSGALLSQFKTGSGIIGQPVSYLGPDGKQYVTILSGVGGWSGAIVSGGLDPRDGSAALGFVNAMTDLPQYTAQGGTLYVFALP